MGVTNLTTFTLDVDKALDGIKADVNQFKRLIAFDLLGRIVERTPVDTGRARANWQVSINAPVITEVRYPNKESIPEGKSESVIAESVKLEGGIVIADVELGEDIWITNNLPYIEVLEQGDHSKQNTEGIVAISVAEVAEGMTRI